MIREPHITHRSEQWWDHFGQCIRRVLESPNPTTNIWLSRGGCPMTYPGIEYTLVGTYTRAVTVQQLLEDLEEAERLRRRKSKK
jgi:hypothetical protein